MVELERLSPDTIRMERMLDAPRETVWRWLTESELRAQWFAGGPLQPRVGGEIELVFDHDNLSADDVPYPPQYAEHRCAVGRETITAYDPPRLIAAADAARQQLNWEPRYMSLEAIVETAWRWHQSHPHGYGK